MTCRSAGYSGTNDDLVMQYKDGGSYPSVRSNNLAGAFSENTWHHVACSRSSGVLTYYLNGVDVGGGAFAHDVPDTVSTLNFGFAYPAATVLPVDYDLYMHDAIVTAGAPKYTTSFTPAVDVPPGRSEWSPVDLPVSGGGAVDSVNGQTGVVSLGAQDLTDVYVPAPQLHRFTNKNSTNVTCDHLGGYAATGSFYIQLSAEDLDGNSTQSWIDTRQVGDSMTFYKDGVEIGTSTINQLGPDEWGSLAVNTLGWMIPRFTMSLTDTQQATKLQYKTTQGLACRSWHFRRAGINRVEANDRWEPVSPGALSGAPERISDLEDVQTETPPATDGPWSATETATDVDGAWRSFFAGAGNRLVIFNQHTDDGTDVGAKYLALQVNDAIKFSGDNITFYDFTIESVSSPNGYDVSIVTNEDPSIVKTFSTLYIGFGGSDPEDGQVLTWVEANNQWEPATPATGGSSAVAWSVTANGTSDYIFAGDGFAGTETDPVLYVVRGQTYEITNSMGMYPFQIQSTSGVGGTAYSEGITNNAVSNGTLTWESASTPR